MRSKKGSILVITLWLMAILAIFGIGLSRISWAGYYFSRWEEGKFFGLYATQAVLMISKYDRMNDETQSYDILAELAHEKEYGEGKFKVIYSLIDEERKIDINSAPSSILKELPSMDMDKALAIVNAENKPFASIKELLMIDEIDEEDYDAIKDLITVHSNGSVNINTCSEEVMSALGIEDDLASGIMDFRKGDDGELYTEDDGAIESGTAILDTLRENIALTLSEEQLLVSLISKEMLGVKSDNYMVEADVYVNDKFAHNYTVVMSKKEKSKKYVVMEWRE